MKIRAPVAGDVYVFNNTHWTLTLLAYDVEKATWDVIHSAWGILTTYDFAIKNDIKNGNTKLLVKL